MPESTVELEVVSVLRETPDVLAFDLALPSGGDLPVWDPGAHIDLVLTPELVRQYSLCGDPADRSRYRIAVLRVDDGRGGSIQIHDMLCVGSRVAVRGPRNTFPLTDAPRYTFIAGGIGITPILPMIRRVIAREAEWRLLYTSRNTSRMAFRSELLEYGYRVHLRASGEAGRIDLDTVIGAMAADEALYCCGPEALTLAVEERCARKYPSPALRVERFQPAVGNSCDDVDFDVVLSSSGQTLAVPAGRTILEVLLDAGEDVLFSCQEGTCGSCETGVLEGFPDHRDGVLSSADRLAGDRMMICVSRSRTRLVLDI